MYMYVKQAGMNHEVSTLHSRLGSVRPHGRVSSSDINIFYALAQHNTKSSEMRIQNQWAKQEEKIT